MARINYDVPDIRALIELVRHGSFNRAADALAITPSALSKRIAKVEASVGGLVVDRTTRSMELTSLGERLLLRAEPLLHALDDCMDEVSRVARGLEGQISVGCVATVAFSKFPFALGLFKQSYPEVRVDLLDGEGAFLTEAILNRKVDFAVTTVFQHHPDLIAENIASDPFVVVCHADHPLAERKRLRWEELRHWKIVGFKAHISTRRLVDEVLQKAGIELSWFYEVRLLSSLLGYLHSGEFIAPVPRLLAAAVPGLVAIPLEGPTLERQIFLVRRDLQMPAPAEALWTIIAELLRTRPSR